MQGALSRVWTLRWWDLQVEPWPSGRALDLKGRPWKKCPAGFEDLRRDRLSGVMRAEGRV